MYKVINFDAKLRDKKVILILKLMLFILCAEMPGIVSTCKAFMLKREMFIRCLKNSGKNIIGEKIYY